MVEGEKVENFVARDISATGMILASILDEFHPAEVLFSATVERLARRSLVFREVAKSRQVPDGSFFKSRLSLMVIVKGSLVSPN